MGLLSVWMNGSLILLPVLQFFLCCLFDLSNFNVIFLSYYIVKLYFCYILLSFLRSLLFPNGRQKRSGSEGNRYGEEQGGIEWGLIKIYYMRKEPIFK